MFIRLKYKLLSCIVMLSAFMTPTMLTANNITVNPALPTPYSTTGQYIMVQFDISWDDSWRTSSGPKNWDAAWVFVKYRVPLASGGDGLWKHASLNITGHTAPAGSTIDIGLWNPAIPFDTIANPGLGAFIYRSADGGPGPFSLSGVQLRWNYRANGVAVNTSVEIQVFAIEMVYVPKCKFDLGSGGTETSHFYKSPTTTNTYSVNNEAAITVGTIDGNLYYEFSAFSGDRLSIPDAFPKGYAAFYCMKYEIKQQDYVNFLNNLTQTQATNRKYTKPCTNDSRYEISGTLVGNYATTNPYVACNHLNYADVSAYLDWSGLRPMTELEFEKACRGIMPPVTNEYAWGTDRIAGGAYTLSGSGNNEIISANYNKEDYSSGPNATSSGNIVTVYHAGSNKYGPTGATSSGNIITVGSTTGLTLGMSVKVSSGTGCLDIGTVVTAIDIDGIHFTVSPLPIIDLTGAQVYGWGTTITVTSTAGLIEGMPVQVINDIATAKGYFYPGTYITSIPSPTTFEVSTPPKDWINENGNNEVTGYGVIIEVSSTEGLIIGMPVHVTPGDLFPTGTVVIAIDNATTFRVTKEPTTPLPGGTTEVTGYFGGNVAYDLTTPLKGGTIGPLRAGIFAGTPDNTGRMSAGATYYGIMEMSGNVVERTVTVGNSTGRAFTGTHGNGTLDVTTGNADISTWPLSNGKGAGFRGGSWRYKVDYLSVSDRYQAAYSSPSSNLNNGGRGIRSAPPVFTTPLSLEVNFCVEDIGTATYYPDTMDIQPVRPDYYLFKAGDPDLNLDLTTYPDYCCPPGTLGIQWQIDFNGGTPLPRTGNGQPSTYGSDIQLPGSATGDVVHTITYHITDCNTYVSLPIVRYITIKPRPNVTKQ